MHKDCILLTGNSAHAETNYCMQLFNEKPLIHYICKHIGKHNFCKIVFSIHPSNESLKDFVLRNRKEYKCAIDFCIDEHYQHTGTAIKNALLYTDSDDVIVQKATIFQAIDYEALASWQHQKEADVTVVLTNNTILQNDTIEIDETFAITTFTNMQPQKNKYAPTGIYSIFRHSFLNIDFPEKFDVEKNYLHTYNTQRDFIGYNTTIPFYNTENERMKLALTTYLNTMW